MKSGFLLPVVFAFATAASATTYVVGPSSPYKTIGSVPWATLQPGDTVLINWQSTPYKEKWVICLKGAPSAPITVQGVPGPNGQLPVIDGASAKTAPGLSYWGEERGVIKIGGATVPSDTMPAYIVIANLEVINASPGNYYYSDTGSRGKYASNAASIYVEKGENITIRNCSIHASGNGIFVGSPLGTPSRNILVEGNNIYGNGNKNSDQEHNTYTEAIGVTFQYNNMGPLKAGSNGINLKDRSAGTIVRYNWIEGGSREIDLVDGKTDVQTAPGYPNAYVYGNVIREITNDSNRQILQWGGDSGNGAAYRNGTLYFYSNTVVSLRTDGTTLFRISDAGTGTVEAYNNTLYATAAGNTVTVLQTTGSGKVTLRYDWLKPGWIAGGAVTASNLIQTASAGFINESQQDYHLASGSVCDNSAGVYSVAGNPVDQEYVKPQSWEVRTSVSDIGAFEKP